VTDARLTEIGRLVVQLAALLGVGASSSPVTYDADRLPPGVTRDAYLRRHRARMRAAVEGWTRVGAARVVTAQAWALEVEAETATARARAKRVAPRIGPVVHRDLKPGNDDALDRALGLRRRRAG
jgi:hypothetical protein